MFERKRELINAAIKVFAQNGYSNSSVAQIVQEAGVAQGTFYLYFKSKKELFLEVMDEFFWIVQKKINSITFQEISNQDQLEAKIKEVFLAVLTSYSENTHLATIFLREAIVIDADFEKKLEEFYDFCTEYVKEYVNIGVERGLLTKHYDANLVSYAIIGMVESLGYKFLIKHKHYDVEQLAAFLAGFECHGLFK